MTTHIKVGDEVIFTGAYRYPTRRSTVSTPAVSSVGIVSAVPGADRVWYLITFPGIGSEVFSRQEFRLKNDPEERRFIDALDMVEAKTGSPGLTSWSDGKVGMALSEFERLAGLLPTAKTGPFEKGETVYFLGYNEPVVIEKFAPGDTVIIQTVPEFGASTSGGYVASESGSRHWVRWDEISRTKP